MVVTQPWQGVSQENQYLQITLTETSTLPKGIDKDAGVFVNIQSLINQKETETNYECDECQ
jgi:hypothetical protein